MKETVLCRLDGIAKGGSAAFAAHIGGARTGVMALRRDGTVFVYVNSCPHMGEPLDFQSGRFLNLERTHVLCSNHDALFRIEDGYCVHGPCAGKSLLQSVEARVGDGEVRIRG
ncbi:MAG: Rieske 2Fe-2S domain-containing protein [Rhodospirillales bacterium]|jgi:nitrite reductase/ring-hydroxylating ferredoxin subunit|nr:Rieske 2Fe-2S domain-containing protein [Rhodospirillales bacterium]HJO72367.1 Rieske 2Fe-2S domain-containing protein [Rhodospirillales bacterium]